MAKRRRSRRRWRTDKEYLDLFLEPIRLCTDYLPKFGTDDEAGISLSEFRALYGGDPLYHWIGFDSKLMFAAHKASGGITSLYRQLGIGCERLVRRIIQDTLRLSDTEVSWSYQYKKTDGSRATITLDARISLSEVRDSRRRNRVRSWLLRAANRIGLPSRRRRALSGVVFEVRQGYKSADSKRQNADLRSAMRAYNQNLLPALMVVSGQISNAVYVRYIADQLLILKGVRSADSTVSTFAFCQRILGYSLSAFFERNATTLRREVLHIVRKLLSPSS